MTLVSFFNFIGDLLFTLIYFRRRDNGGSPPRRVAGLFCLLLTVVLYPSGLFPFLAGTVQRYLIRAVLTALFAYLSLSIHWFSALYAALYWSTVQLLIQSLFFSPRTYPVFTGLAVFTGQAHLDVALCVLLTLAVKGLFALLCDRLTPVRGISPLQTVDLLPEVLIAALAIYTRELAIPLTLLADTTERALSNYYLILQLVLFLLLLFMEFMRRFRNDSAVALIQKQEAEALLQNIQNQNENARAISALRHDLKNHLLSLSLLIRDGRGEEALSYLDSLSGSIVQGQIIPATGNDLVDGLFSLKLTPAVREKTQVQIKLDLRQSDFLSNTDLCILFGNLLDNALEACQRAEHPSLSIGGGVSANMLLLHFENTCKHSPVLVDGLPVTEKKNTLLHGHGLRNVRGVVEKYGGNLSIAWDKRETFMVDILIPIPPDDEGTR